MPSKQYWIMPEQMRPLIPRRGGCIASDRITVEGKLVGQMYRENPKSEQDNGWRFLAGDETPEDMKDPDRHGFHDVNAVANIDTAIIPYLDALVGAIFKRDWKTFRFVPQNLPAKKLKLK